MLLFAIAMVALWLTIIWSLVFGRASAAARISARHSNAPAILVILISLLAAIAASFVTAADTDTPSVSDHSGPTAGHPAAGALGVPTAATRNASS